MAYEFKNLLVDIADGIAVVTINRPKSLNALNSETLAELDACFAQIEADPEAKVLILTGSGMSMAVARMGRAGSSTTSVSRRRYSAS